MQTLIETPDLPSVKAAAEAPPRPLKIAYLYHRSDTMGGAPIHLRDLSRRLISEGHDTRIFIGGDGPFLENLEAHGVPYESLKFLQRAPNPAKDFPAIFELYGKLKKFRPDLISAHCPKAGFAGRIAGKWLGIPTVYTPHCWPFAKGAPNGKVYRAFEKLVIPATRHIFLVSEDERNEALEHSLCPNELMTTIHNGMLDGEEGLRADPAQSPPRMIMVARFEAQKDHETLFRALARIRHLEWGVDLVGSGPDEERFKSLATELEIADRVVFHGHSTRVPELLSAAQIFLLITHWEGFPRSTLEAMRAGLPSVVSDVGGNREAFVSGKEGIVVGEDAVDELVPALEQLVTRPELRARMGEEARATFESHFTFDRMYRKYLASYFELVGTGPAASSG